MKNKILIFGFIFVSIMFACKVDKNCPAFVPEDLENIAYHEHDTLKFLNSDQAEFNIYINEINLSESFDQECDDLYKICPCLNSVEVLATNSTSSSSYVFLKMEQSDVSEMQYFYYQVMDFYFELDFNNEVQYIDQFPYLDMENISINNVNYTNVIVYSNLDISSSSVEKVYLTKFDGILRIQLKNGTVWNRVN